MRYIIVDLEATCWEVRTATEQMETIEIGAVALASAAGPAAGEFASFVRPVASPQLSDFCRQLTSIEQRDVDGAGYFWEVFAAFVEWAGEGQFTWCSWGGYDLNQLRADCRRHGLDFPAAFERHINLKREFARLNGVGRCGLAAALKLKGLPLIGTHHRGIDDARNIAALALGILPVLEEEL